MRERTDQSPPATTSVITIREYRESSDACPVGRLIADTYSEFNLAFASPRQRGLLLGPFRHAASDSVDHQAEIARVICASHVYVAEEDAEIVGVLRGRVDRLQSLFVRGDQHRRGIGRQLVERFHQECLRQGDCEIKVAATLYAVPFYLAMGYKRTTGVRRMGTFEGQGLPYQPMKKVLDPDERG
jgi:GNAT superfamily N-acetyltransferase